MKKLIILSLIVLSVLGIYYGAYQPLIKSRKYIAAKKAMVSVKTLEDFESVYDEVFKTPSPVGDEEILKFFGYDVAGLVGSEKQSEGISRKLIAYAEPKMLKNNVRHLLISGGTYETIWRKYKNDTDFFKAEEYYKKSLEIGPRVPNALYGLLGLYRDRGDTEKMKEIGERILELWPNDENTKKLLDESITPSILQ